MGATSGAPDDLGRGNEVMLAHFEDVLKSLLTQEFGNLSAVISKLAEKIDYLAEAIATHLPQVRQKKHVTFDPAIPDPDQAKLDNKLRTLVSKVEALESASSNESGGVLASEPDMPIATSSSSSSPTPLVVCQRVEVDDDDYDDPYGHRQRLRVLRQLQEQENDDFDDDEIYAMTNEDFDLLWGAEDLPRGSGSLFNAQMGH